VSAAATMSIPVPSKTFTRAEVAKHNTEDSTWFIIDTVVYDVSEFVDAHPGGEAVLRQVAGTDATVAFYNLHRHEALQKYADLAIGTIEGEKQSIIALAPGEISTVPYAEPLWLTPQFKSPYFNDSHRSLQRAMRKFTDLHITPEAIEKERTGEYVSQDLIDKMSKAGVLHMRMGPGKHLHGVNLLDGAVDGKEFDYFHDMICSQEGVRGANRGFQDVILTLILTINPNPNHKPDANEPLGKHGGHGYWIDLHPQLLPKEPGPPEESYRGGLLGPKEDLPGHHGGLRGVRRRRPAHDRHQDA
jgi:hypothetical protein